MSFSPILEKDVVTWTDQKDVLVVGFGGAGACSAIEAFDNGASVAIFEAASESGGVNKVVLSGALLGRRHNGAEGRRL